MGQAVSSAAAASDATIVASLNRGDDIDDHIENCDVVIDFSRAGAIEQICEACLRGEKPLVVGTTGHSDEQRAFIDQSAQSIPIILSPNFSVGINTLFWLTQKAAELLGPDFDLEIVEMHHRSKKDAPSGTAKRLAEILSEVRNLDYDKNVAHGRAGLVGKRPRAQIGMHAIRGGDVICDHTVMFAGPGERIELVHKATSRETFALGALRAARWLMDKPPGLYSMEDVLGLSLSPVVAASRGKSNGVFH
jgi:4-hydroxy-tetrahydrodipicolinate reductase